MAQPKRKDTNQPDMEKALRAAGFSVQSLHTVGKGVPDLLLGLYGLNILIEVKNNNSPLTEAEVAWHRGWAGQVRIAQTPAEVLLYVRNHADYMKRILDSVAIHCEIQMRKIEMEDNEDE